MRWLTITLLTSALSVVAAGVSARAEQSGVPPEVLAKVRAIGPVLNDETRQTARALYERHQPEIGPELRVLTDVAYGPAERHKLDIVTPLQPPTDPMPVVIFFHGGAYVRGNKTLPGTPFLTNIAAFWARNQMIGINANYRLAPEHQWPAGAEDVGRSVTWARMHAAEYGGNPDRIIVMGHSAGASHLATYVFDKRFKPSTGSDGVVGAVLLSGGYDPTREATAGRRAYYGEDEATYPDRAAIRHISESTTPIFIGFAEYDPVRFQLEAVNLFTALCERDKRCPPMKQLIGHNHMTEIYHIGTTDQSLTQELIAFVNRVK